MSEPDKRREWTDALQKKVTNALRAKDRTLIATLLDGVTEVKFREFDAEMAALFAELLKEYPLIQKFQLAGDVVPLGLLRDGGTHSLDLAGKRFAENEAIVIASLLQSNTALKYLKLEDNALGPRGVTALAQALKVNSTLISLGLARCGMEGGAVVLAEALKVNTGLQMLNVSENSINDVGALAFADAFKSNSALKSFDFRGNHPTEKPSRALATVVLEHKSLDVFGGLYTANNVGISTLTITNSGSGLSEVFVVAELLKSNHIWTTVDVSKNPMGDAGVSALAEALKENKTVTFLDVSKTNISDGAVKILAEMLKVNQRVTNLDVSQNSIKDQGATALGEALLVNSTLFTLNLSKNQIADQGLLVLSKGLEVHKALKKLDLAHNKIGPEGSRGLGEVCKLNGSIQILDLCYNKIGLEGAKLIAAGLAVNKTLRILHLKGNGIMDGGSNAIMRALFVNAQLESLDLASNNLTSAGGAAIRETLKVNKGLTHLDVSYNALGDDGLSTLIVGLQPQGSLKRLDLAKTGITQKGAENLSNVLQNNTSLEYIQMDLNAIQTRGAEALARGLVIQMMSRNRRIIASYGRHAIGRQFKYIQPTEVMIEDKFMVQHLKDVAQTFGSPRAVFIFAMKAAAQDSLIMRLLLSSPLGAEILQNLLSPIVESELPLPHHLTTKQAAEVHEWKDIIVDLAWKYPDTFRQPDLSTGVTASEAASKEMAALINPKLNFCNRYEPITFMPEHRSPTCVVFRARDVDSKRQEVVLKLMKRQEQYQRELDQRVDLDAEFVVVDVTPSANFPQWTEDAARLYKCDGYSWGLVMPAAQRNLMAVILQERLDLAGVRNLMFSLSRCLEHMHSKDRIHGDVKPLNVVRMKDGSWKLIDLDASVAFGQRVGTKSSSAYCPPESQGALLADPSFDMWGVGCVLLRAVAHRPLLEADDRDDLRGVREETTLAQWDFKKLEQLLEDVDGLLRDDSVPEDTRIVICDLLGWLLHPEARSRATAKQVQNHPFNQQGSECFMSPMHLMACEPDTKDNVEKLETMIAKASVDELKQHVLGKTPLHVAAEMANMGMLRMLLTCNKVDPDAVDLAGNTALHCVLHALHRDELLTETLLPVARALALRSNLDLLDGSNPPTPTLELGRKSANAQVRNLFENDMVEVQVLAALSASPPRPFAITDFDNLFSSKGEEVKNLLFTAVMKLLSEWGFARVPGGPEEQQSAFAHYRGDFVRSIILKLHLWQTPSYFATMQDLARQRLDLVHKDMYRIRDGLKDQPGGAFIVEQLVGLGKSVVCPVPYAEILRCCPDTPRLRNHVDEQVFVPLIRGVAIELELVFKDTLQSCLSGSHMVTKKKDIAELPEDWQRWVTVAPVKGAARMSAKVREYREEMEQKGEALASWPHISFLGDTLRAMVVCRTAQAIEQTWHEIDETFQVTSLGRLKNNFNAAGRDGHTEKPPDMLLNAVLQGPGNTLPMTVEIQIHHVDILRLKDLEAHLLYEVVRASAKDFLAPTGGD